VIAIDPGPAASRQLCDSKRRERDELERADLVRTTDHRAPVARPKKTVETDIYPHKGKALVRARARRASELKKADG